MLHERPRLRPYMFQASFKAGREEGLTLGLKTANKIQSALYTSKLEGIEAAQNQHIRALQRQIKGLKRLRLIQTCVLLFVSVALLFI